MSLEWKDERGRDLRDCDFPCDPTLELCVGERAFEVLSGPLEGCAEFLPLDCGERGLWLVNPLARVPVDENASDMYFLEPREPNPEELVILDPVFRPEDLEGVLLFRTAQQPNSRPLATEEFVALVEGAGLTGLDFYAVWEEVPGRDAPRDRIAAEDEPLRGPVPILGDPEGPPVETKLDAEGTQAVLESAALAAAELGLDETDPGEAIVGRIDARAVEIGRRPTPDTDRVVWDMAYLFGERLRQASGWEWVLLHHEGRSAPTLALVAPDRSVYVAPGDIVAGVVASGEERALAIYVAVSEGLPVPGAGPGLYLKLG